MPLPPARKSCPCGSGLKILSTTAGQPKDKTGKVEFEASYFLNRQTQALAGHSRFKRMIGEWMYLDGKSTTPIRYRMSNHWKY